MFFLSKRCITLSHEGVIGGTYPRSQVKLRFVFTVASALVSGVKTHACAVAQEDGNPMTLANHVTLLHTAHLFTEAF